MYLFETVHKAKIFIKDKMQTQAYTCIYRENTAC